MNDSIHRSPAPIPLQTQRGDFGLSRRDFVRLAAVATAAGLAGLPLSLGGCGYNPNRPVRPEITTASSGTIQNFEKAITWMQGLPESDPRSWISQAKIHLSHCRHHGWLFFPWHRAYLYYFEQICRVGCGDNTFTLPYWDWTAHPQIPAVFWNTSSPLFYDPTKFPDSLHTFAKAINVSIDSRTATKDWIIPDFITGSTTIENKLKLSDFYKFAGEKGPLNDTRIQGNGGGGIENTPHDLVHGFVGGAMGAFLSPLDPIFWTHHCRADELWVEWNILRKNNNTNESDWLNTTFDEFVDGQGKAVKISVYRTLSMPLFDYRYDTQPVH